MKTESIVWCIENANAYIFGEEAQAELSSITAYIAELEVANASMQNDSRLANMAWKDNQAALNKQAEEIRELKGISANLAKHLEAIQNIAEREDGLTILPNTARTIRAYCEAANVMEAV